MGLLFRKRLRLSKWLSLNLSKSGLGLSVGPPGAKLSMNQKRARVQLGVPGTGLGYRRDMSLPQEPTIPQEGEEPSTPPHHHARAWLIVGLVALLLLVYLLSGCGFAEWRDRTLRDVAEGRSHLDVGQIPPAGSGPSQTIEFRDNAGRTVGYGRVQGGTVEFFNPDSSRAGFGRIGR